MKYKKLTNKIKIIHYYLKKLYLHSYKYSFITHFILKISKKKTTVPKVIILGIPRSGTSFLAGAITKLGYHPGPRIWLKPANKNNKYGYFECMPILNINERILKLSKINYFSNNKIYKKPDLKLKSIIKEQKKIQRLINNGRIEVLKDNKIINLVPLYASLYPDAKWIFIKRDTQETYKSNFGKPIQLKDYKKFVENNTMFWNESKKSVDYIEVDYKEFREDKEKVLRFIINHLEIQPTKKQLNEFHNFFKPRRT